MVTLRRQLLMKLCMRGLMVGGHADTSANSTAAAVCSGISNSNGDLPASISYARQPICTQPVPCIHMITATFCRHHSIRMLAWPNAPASNWMSIRRPVQQLPHSWGGFLFNLAACL